MRKLSSWFDAPARFPFALENLVLTTTFSNLTNIRPPFLGRLREKSTHRLVRLTLISPVGYRKRNQVVGFFIEFIPQSYRRGGFLYVRYKKTRISRVIDDEFVFATSS